MCAYSNGYLTWPELPTLQNIFEVISDDVGFLKKQSHRVGQPRVGANGRVLQLWDREKTGKTNADQTGHVVTILQRSTTKHLFTIAETMRAIKMPNTTESSILTLTTPRQNKPKCPECVHNNCLLLCQLAAAHRYRVAPKSKPLPNY